MTLTSDLEVLKDIPGYKPILKAVLKSQIQFLVEQLSDHTGEESVLLTASVAEGSLSHLGSNTGRHFIEGHDDVKAMFLTYCLKNGQMDDDDMPVKTKTTPSRLIALAKRSPATPGTSSIQPDNRKRKPGAPIVMETSSPKTMKLAPTGDYPGEDDGDDHVELEEDEGDQGSGEGATGPATQTKRTAKPFMYPGNGTSVTSAFLDSTPMSSLATSVGTLEHVASTAENTTAFHEIVTIKTEPLAHLTTDTSRTEDSDMYNSQTSCIGVRSGNFDEYTSSIPQNWTSAYDPLNQLASVHESDAVPASDSCNEASEVPWECCFCKKKFTSDSYLQTHMINIHHRSVPRVHTCDICEKTFNRKFNMEQHKKLHFDIKPFECDQCGKKFSRQDRMKIHRAGHFPQRF